MPRSIVILAVLAGAAALSSCGLRQVWTKPGANQAIFAQERYACMLDSVSAAAAIPAPQPAPVYHPAFPVGNSLGGSVIGAGQVAEQSITAQRGSVIQGQLFRACMEASGWRLVRASELAAE